jgi:ribosomal protein S24E
MLAKKIKSKVECTVVEHIYQKFGKLESYGIAKIYNKPVDKKVKEKKEKKPEEAPEEKKAEEKPKEEVPKEEAPEKEEIKEKKEEIK